MLELKPRVFLHIGANKTGTTALQNYFAGQPGLNERGVLYPRTGRGTPGAGGNSHVGLATALGFGRAVEVPDPDRLTGNLHREIAGSGCQNVVLSAEYFMLRRDIEPVAACLEPYETTVLVYLRRHDHWLESLMLQGLQTVADPPWSLAPDSFMDHHARTRGQYLDYAELLSAWSAAFGQKNICVRPYEAEQNAPSLVADFLQAIELRHLFPEVGGSESFVNRTPPPDVVELIRRIKASRLPEALKRVLVDLVRSGSPLGAQRSIFDVETRKGLLRRFEDQYAEIARTYLGRADGRLFLDMNVAEDPVAAQLDMPGLDKSLRYILKGLFSRRLWNGF